MPWKTGREHPTNESQKPILGPTHTDTYHTNDAGKRDQPHNTDLKISGPKHAPSMREIHPPPK